MTQTVGFADRDALLPLGDNRPGTKLTSFNAVVLHETANENPGASAALHVKYWSPGGGGRTVSSAHFVVDSIESIQLIPTNEQAWHAGDVVGNTTGVGLEICVNSRNGYATACRKAAKIAARVLHANGKAPQDGVTLRKHGSYPGTTHKLCPQHLNAADWGVSWAQMVGFVQQEYALLTTSVDYAAIWGSHYVYHEGWGIETEWKRAATVLGAPTTDEHSADDGTVTRHFSGGYIRYTPATGKAVSYFARSGA